MVDSPCKFTCIIENNQCIGCKRTLEEISNWLEYTDQEKEQIIKDIKERK